MVSCSCHWKVLNQNNGKTTQIIHLFIGVWNHDFHHPFWGVLVPLFLVQHPYWKVLTLIAKWIGDKKKQEEWLQGIFLWSCEEPNKIPANFKTWLRGFLDVLIVPNFWGTFFWVSGYMDIQKRPYRLRNLNFRVKILGDLFGVFDVVVQ